MSSSTVFLVSNETVDCQSVNEFSLEVAFPNLTFNKPVGLISDPAGGNRLFVVEQDGTVRVFDNAKNVSASNVFLDISNQVVSAGEMGLLGFAFHPNFNQTPYVYVNYVASNPMRTVIARFTVSESNPDFADANTMQTVLEFNQPFTNHNGGQLAFGPDGNLYIGTGDGGGAGDPQGNGQNLSTVLGKILRIDVDSGSPQRNYAIPSDNPFFGNNLGYREEIYAFGFRNPWRFSFDSVTEQLWVGDVGQNQLEEIDIVQKGGNYGWNIMEGDRCFDPPSGCDQTGLELPVWSYPRDDGFAVIGGYVYRGVGLPSLFEAYVYADYGSGRIWAFRCSDTAVTNTLLADSGLNIASLGVDAKNELYFAANNGKIYQLTIKEIPEYPTMTAVIVVLAAMLLAVILVKKNASAVGSKKG